MGIKDPPYSRAPATAMRDLLRLMDRKASVTTVARPTAPPPPAPLMAMFSAPEGDTNTVTIGDWTLSQNADGDLVAENRDGTTKTIATKGTL